MQRKNCLKISNHANLHTSHQVKPLTCSTCSGLLLPRQPRVPPALASAQGRGRRVGRLRGLRGPVRVQEGASGAQVQCQWRCGSRWRSRWKRGQLQRPQLRSVGRLAAARADPAGPGRGQSGALLKANRALVHWDMACSAPFPAPTPKRRIEDWYTTCSAPFSAPALKRSTEDWYRTCSAPFFTPGPKRSTKDRVHLLLRSFFRSDQQIILLELPIRCGKEKELDQDEARTEQA